ncbi:hypothetical protein BX600DRAFT_510955 [Xylariales sp. PMI_506]|nr:hypothetical protein BX600DRAFT_510955 [Xylariales sp. PMI_506]
MGVSGLLPLLKSIQKPIELKKYAGETLAVDAYGWLHRGAIACAIELAQGKPTTKYIAYCVRRLKMMQHFGVTPYLVFDGDYLPSKASTEASRAKRREESRQAGLEFLKAGKPAQAHKELQKAVDITPEMARRLIEELKKMNLPYVVAPYEADPQMVYLEREGIVSGIISEDSDLLVFGAKRLLTKLDEYGQCVEVNRRDFAACREISLTAWTDAQFRHMAIFSGCDYLAGIKEMGLKTAYRMLRKHKTPEKVIRMLHFDGKYRVPPDYLEQFTQAEQTFLYQRVFCPKAKAQVCLTQPPDHVNIDEMPFVGAAVEPSLAHSIATGDVNPFTKEAIVLPASPDARKRRASSSVQAAPIRTVPPPKPIDSYFKGDGRIPMGNMDPNCFTVDPQRVASMTENGQRPIVFPLPRPYLGDSALQASNISRRYTNINQNNGSTPALRRRTEPISNILRDAGIGHEGIPRRQSSGLSQRRISGQRISEPNMLQPPAKKARLCGDAPAQPLPNQQTSKFFPSGAKTKDVPVNTEGYLMSDDSIEDALRDLPDIDGWHSTKSKKQSFVVFEEKVDDVEQDNDATEKSGRGEEESIPEKVATETPLHSSISRFTFSQTNSGSSSQRLGRDLSGFPTPATSSSQSSSTRSTPVSSLSSATTISTVKSTPATPLLTPLQRLGARALNGGSKQPPTPTFAAPRPIKRSSNNRRTLDALPINPSFVPLPPVDVAEVEALHHEGSEDMIIPESENENEEGQENMGKPGNGRGARRMDLSRFVFA